MSDTKCCENCILWGEPNDDKLGCCNRKGLTNGWTWPDATCPSFERKRDKWDKAAHEVGRALNMEARADVLRRYFPEPDRAAIRKVLGEKLAVGYCRYTADEITDAILSALKGEA